MDLLIRPLADWDGTAYRQHAEWVTVVARVELLHAHAQCARLHARGGGGELAAGAVARAHRDYMWV
eukprot:19720-Chlamydomonas_euryale.AAC.5